MTAATYQYVDLPDASVVTTRALLTARENIGDTVAARAMMCIHGGAGFGKTLAVNTCLRELEPGEDVRKITFRARPTARAVRYELFTAVSSCFLPDGRSSSDLMFRDLGWTVERDEGTRLTRGVLSGACSLRGMTCGSV
ncbi:hypothetical protein [Streptomyces sp. NPDC006477]|uniref:hypothetical protein n=1 Tax=Streptomyces sp. NPDC006477 TaxID=3364747 RepID=UPI003674D7EC